MLKIKKRIIIFSKIFITAGVIMTMPFYVSNKYKDLCAYVYLCNEEFCDYVDSIESVELAECMKYTKSMVDLQILGGLSEQELALVKRIPAENMPENEPDYQEHKQVLHYEEGKVYCYQLKTDTFDIAVITTDGVFQTKDSSPAEYARIVAFEQDGYRTEPVKNYDNSRHERVRYYFYSEEMMTQWKGATTYGTCTGE